MISQAITFSLAILFFIQKQENNQRNNGNQEGYKKPKPKIPADAFGINPRYNLGDQHHG
ncbi:hypothetical protein [Pedobacter sp. ASV12]|uniref:hypothetical protein n=1 Tax=Pedobacter sp. ASV12 TaxID=2795120 RepID=UPI001E3155AB|nr:hypothetical protein [Pedobacter sp. ASV12]